MQIVVLGMHRSGTSMVARLINMMGAYFGPEGSGLQLSEENPKGFWERNDIMTINEKVLDALDSSWFGIGRIAETPSFKGKKFDTLRKEARKIILGMDAFRPWFIKDPRFCITLPFWQKLLEQPVYVFVFREPMQVAISLNIRNDFPIDFGLALWEQYNKVALANLKDQSVFYVEFDTLLSNPISTVEKLYSFLSKKQISPIKLPSQKEIEAFLSKKLKRSKTSKYDQALLQDSQKKLFVDLKKGSITDFELSASSYNILALFEQVMGPFQDYNNLIRYATSKGSKVSDLAGLQWLIDSGLESNHDKNLLSELLKEREFQERKILELKNQKTDVELVHTKLEFKNQLISDKLEQSKSAKDKLTYQLEEAKSAKDKLTYQLEEAKSAKDKLTHQLEEVKSAKDKLTYQLELEKGENAGLRNKQEKLKLDVEKIKTSENQLRIRKNELREKLNHEKSKRLSNKLKRLVGITPHKKEKLEAQNRQTDIVELPMDIELAQFDSGFYLKTYQDVKGSGLDPEKHYYEHGESEGRKPNPWFDPAYYLSIYADVRSLGLSPFKHYVEHGQFENKEVHSVYVNNRSKHLRPILFVGHDGIKAGSEVVLLEVIKWFYRHTSRPIKILLLNAGELAASYSRYGEILVLSKRRIDDTNLFNHFFSENWEFLYLNTVVSGNVIELIREQKLTINAPIIAHIHEMEKVLLEYKDELAYLKEVTDYWITASDFSTKDLIEKFQISKEKVTTVSAFISPFVKQYQDISEIKRTSRKELGVSDDSFVVIGCGTAYWRKGPDLFLETARNVGANPNIEFVWIGGGTDLEIYKDDLTTDERKYIHFVGNKTNSNELIAAGDLFYLSSREDPFPLVVMEAAQYGIPTICFEPTTGITGFLKKDAGITIPTIDTSIAAEKINEIVKNEKERQSLGMEGKKRVFSEYTTDHQCLRIYSAIRNNTKLKPSVSVIVPFYNHEEFVEDRLDSILDQSIKDIEIILLDDCSDDKTAEKALALTEKDPRVKHVFNEKNSGSPFKQWELGLSLSNSELIWIAEGDDSCELDFLERLLGYFKDPLVNIASARTEIIDENGDIKEGALLPYLETACEGKFKASYVKDGIVEVNENMGVMCTLVNASGLVIRKSALGEILNQAVKFKMCGDWLVYLNALKNRKIAYDHKAVNYFRRHDRSVVNKIEGTDIYFQERYKISEFIVNNFSIDSSTLLRAFETIDNEWERFEDKKKNMPLEHYYDKKKLDIIQEAKSKEINFSHVGFYVHGMLFSKGGIEKLAADLSNELVNQGVKVTVFCRSWGDKKPVYPLMESVEIISVFNEVKIEESKNELRKALIDSQVEIFVPMLSEWLFDPVIDAAEGLGIPIIASEHNDPWKIEEYWWDTKKRQSCFKKVDRIHVLLNKFRESFLPELQDKVEVIPNGVVISETIPKTKEKLIIGVGRLAKQKGFDRLIDAVAKMDLPDDWRVEIYGEGSEREALEEQISSKYLDSIICLKGNVNDIFNVYKKASIMVMSSEFEGFGIALVEAMAHGVVPIGYSDCNGPNEIIRDKKDGYLVTSNEQLAEKLQLLIENDKQRKTLGQSSYQRSKEFSMEKFFEKWMELLNTTIKNQKS